MVTLTIGASKLPEGMKLNTAAKEIAVYRKETGMDYNRRYRARDLEYKFKDPDHALLFKIRFNDWLSDPWHEWILFIGPHVPWIAQMLPLCATAAGRDQVRGAIGYQMFWGSLKKATYKEKWLFRDYAYSYLGLD